jgi:hypothetical protein
VGAKSAIGTGNLIYEVVELERWGEEFGTCPEKEGEKCLEPVLRKMGRSVWNLS